MSEIITVTLCLAAYLSKTQLKQLRHIVLALLGMTGWVTMLGLSRWTEAGGGSYRTIQRWFQTTLDWGLLLWAMIRTHLRDPDGLYLMAADDVVVSKARKKTHGVGRFYSSIAGRPIPSLSFLALSLIDVEQRRSYPLAVAQHLPAPKAIKAAKTTEKIVAAAKRGRGCPQGSKNHAKTAPTLSSELTLLQAQLRVVLKRIAPLPVKHLVLDGFFGTYPATWLVRDCGLHLISKLRHNAVIYFPYTGPKPKRGPTPRYGDKLDYKALPEHSRYSSLTEGRFVIDTYRMTVWHKDFPDPLNVVVVVKTDTRAHKSSHVVLFSTDLRLTATQISDYYSLRFQIEFNFRDAKQYWGLEDFMNVSDTAVTNTVNLAFLMVNLSALLLTAHRQQHANFSVLDLKNHFRTHRYLYEILKSLPDPPASDFVLRLRQRLSALGGIRPPSDLQMRHNWRGYCSKQVAFVWTRMLMKRLLIPMIALLLLLQVFPALAHDPHFETADWGGLDNPFVVPVDPTVSFAMYGYLEDHDTDAIALDFKNIGDKLTAQLLVPVCGKHYTDFYPQMAVVGPGLPMPSNLKVLPFALPQGMGTQIIEMGQPDASGKRPTLYEDFGALSSIAFIRADSFLHRDCKKDPSDPTAVIQPDYRTVLDPVVATPGATASATSSATMVTTTPAS